MDKIYEQAKDLHVVCTIIYGNGDVAGFAYKDSECTIMYTAEELKEAFVKGALVSINDVLYKPLSYGIGEFNRGVVNYVSNATNGNSHGDNAMIGCLQADRARNN